MIAACDEAEVPHTRDSTPRMKSNEYPKRGRDRASTGGDCKKYNQGGDRERIGTVAPLPRCRAFPAIETPLERADGRYAAFPITGSVQ